MLRRGAREALGQFERAAKLAPGTPDPLAEEAQAYVALKQAPDAVKAAEAAVRAHNESAGSYVFLAGIHERLGPSADHDAAAIAAYRQAIARDAGHTIALNNLAYLLGKDPARLDEAVALAERAYRAAPRSPAVADTRPFAKMITATGGGCRWLPSKPCWASAANSSRRPASSCTVWSQPDKQ